MDSKQLAELAESVRRGEVTPDEYVAAWQESWDICRRRAETDLGIVHWNGAPWHEASLPRRWHRCWAQTSSFSVQRCPCGAMRMTGSCFWLERNSRRKSS